MATVHIRMGAVMGGGAPVYAPIARMSQTITSSGTSQQSAASEGGEYASIVASGGNVFVSIGSNPTALAAGGNKQDLILDGQRIDFGPLSVGDKIAIIDAS